MNKEKIFILSFAVLSFLIYGQSLWGSFVFDDRGIIEHQAMLGNLSGLKETAIFPYWTEDAGLYRPTTLLSYSFNIIFLGGSAMSFHLVNILLYIGIIVSIYVLLKRLFKNDLLACFIALMFLVLPIHTEVVANITGRSELLALLFSLLTLLEFTKEKINFWLAGLFMLLAIGAKETAVATLGLIPLLILIQEKWWRRELLDKYFRGVSAAVIGVMVYLVIRFFVLGTEHFLGVETSLIENPLLFADTTGRVATAFSILWMYIAKTFWPVNLCSDYSYNQIPILTSLAHWSVILGLVSYIGALVTIVVCLFRKPLVSWAAAWFAVSFLLVSNFLFPIGTIAGERLFFFASLGPVIIVTFLLLKFGRKPLLLSLIAIYAVVSFGRQGVWLSEERLFLNAEQCAPESVLSLSNAGAAYLFQGKLDQAAERLERSREIKPIYSKGLNNLGLVYWKQGRNREAEALYFESLKQKYPYSGAIENLQLLYLGEGDYQKARGWLRFTYDAETVEAIIKTTQDQLTNQ